MQTRPVGRGDRRGLAVDPRLPVPPRIAEHRDDDRNHEPGAPAGGEQPMLVPQQRDPDEAPRSRAVDTHCIRDVQTHAGAAYDASTARFEQEHGDSVGGVLSSDDLERAERRPGVRQLAAAEVDAMMRAFDERPAHQQQAVDAVRFLSPAIVVQQRLDEVAGTGTARYRRFAAQVGDFHAVWRDFFTPKVQANAALTREDDDALPRFV